MEFMNIDFKLFIPSTSTTTRGHTMKLFKHHTNSLIRSNFFSNRVINDWNSLPQFVTGHEKTGLIYIKYTYSYYGAYLSFYTLYLNSVNFNEQLRIFYTCDKHSINILCLE